MNESGENAAVPVKRGYAGAVALITPIVLFIFLLGAPGFLAGILSRTNHVCFWTGSGWYCTPTFSGDAARIALFPASKLMEHSAAVHRFYLWQYKMVGGEWIYYD